MSTTPEERGARGPERAGQGRVRLALAIAAVVVALVSGVLIGRSTATVDRPEGLASAEVSSFLDARVSAVNGDAGESEADIGAYYSPRAVLEEQDQQPPVVTRGRDEIASRLFSLRALGGFSITQLADAIQVGRYVAEGLGWTGGEGISVYELDADDHVVHQWVIGGPAVATAGD